MVLSRHWDVTLSLSLSLSLSDAKGRDEEEEEEVKEEERKEACQWITLRIIILELKRVYSCCEFNDWSSKGKWLSFLSKRFSTLESLSSSVLYFFFFPLASSSSSSFTVLFLLPSSQSHLFDCPRTKCTLLLLFTIPAVSSFFSFTQILRLRLQMK